MRATLLFGTAVVGILWSSSPARACTPSWCIGARTIPAGGQVPANTPAFAWFAGGGLDTSVRDEIELVRIDTGERVQVSTEEFGSSFFGPSYFLRPQVPLAEGASYRIMSPDCGDPGSYASEPIVVTGSAPFPTTLGRLTARAGTPCVEVPAGGACSASIIAAVVDVELELSDEARPWADVLMFETEVDGREWRPTSSIGRESPVGASWVGRARDLIYAACDVSGYELSEGAHRVRMSARIPGTDRVVESEPLEVSLRCPAPDARPEAPQFPERCADLEWPPEPAPMDGGLALDAASTPGALLLEEKGCGCASTAGRRETPAWSTLLLASALLFALRRRSGRCYPPR